jgi:signal transduction histidine kinase
MVPESTLTFTQFGVTLNVAGMAIALLVSVAIAFLYPRPFFRAWTWHYVFSMLAVGGETATLPVRHHSLWALVQVAIYMLATHFLFHTIFELVGARAPRAYAPVMAATGLASCGLMLFQAPYELVALPPLLLTIFAHGWLGVAMVRTGRNAARGLGLLLLSTCVVCLTYPLVVNTPHFWMGFATMGVLHALIGTGMAIFVLEESAEQLRRQHQELQEVDRLKTNFLATMSHELRTPLTVILGNGQLLQEGAAGPLDEVQSSLVDNMCDHTERMSRLIEDLLDFSRMEVGSMRFHLVDEDLNGLVGDVAGSMRPSLERAGLTLTVATPSEPTIAAVDPVKLAQVLTNLLANAAKFTPAGDVVVQLSRDGERARVVVRDTGIGIAPEEQARVFDKFYQVEGGPTRQAGGTGLGLAICKAIVEEGHQGRIWVESTPGQGSAFVFELPLSPGQAATAA